MPEGNLYNEPEISPSYEAESAFQTVAFPIIDGSVDIGHLIRRAENEMEYLQLSASTGGQYMKAWRELYISLYLGGDTAFTRDRCRSFIKDTTSTRAIALC